MKKMLFEEIKRLIRHGAAPLVAILVGGDLISEDQGVNLVNAALVVGTTIFTIIWSMLRAKFPFVALL